MATVLAIQVVDGDPHPEEIFDREYCHRDQLEHVEMRPVGERDRIDRFDNNREHVERDQADQAEIDNARQRFVALADLQEVMRALAKPGYHVMHPLPYVAGGMLRHLSAIKYGGRGRNRTGIKGFAVLRIATLPPGR